MVIWGPADWTSLDGDHWSNSDDDENLQKHRRNCSMTGQATLYVWNETKWFQVRFKSWEGQFYTLTAMTRTHLKEWSDADIGRGGRGRALRDLMKVFVDEYCDIFQVREGLVVQISIVTKLPTWIFSVCTVLYCTVLCIAVCCCFNTRACCYLLTLQLLTAIYLHYNCLLLFKYTTVACCLFLRHN